MTAADRSSRISSNVEKETRTMKRAMRRLRVLPGITGATAAMLAMAVPGLAMAAPELDVALTHEPSSGLAAGGRITYAAEVSNVGTSYTSGDVTVKFELPSLPAGQGMNIVGVSDRYSAEFGSSFKTWECTIAGDAQSAECEGPELFEFGPFALPIGPGEGACQEFSEEELGEYYPCWMLINVEAESGLVPHTTVSPTAEVSGGGAASAATTEDETKTWKAWDITRFDSYVSDELGDPYNQAGGNPFEVEDTMFITAQNDGVGYSYPYPGEARVTSQTTRLMKDLITELPRASCSTRPSRTPAPRPTWPPATAPGIPRWGRSNSSARTASRSGSRSTTWPDPSAKPVREASASKSPGAISTSVSVAKPTMASPSRSKTSTRQSASLGRS